ncbi:MAG TPA: right-handed parallel beta-helix repeat-containing protein [Sedimentisphaerales bacterium]|nr:right-handed parallel beta-helix repeat-containing protein [Sedimentisphaerales bacterium]
MKMEGVRGKILSVTIVMCSLWIGTFSFTLDAVANDDPMYDLIVTVVSGHGTVEPDSGSYFAGTEVTLTATPEAGSYVVRQWTGTNDDTSCTLTNTVTMDSYKTVTVEFGQRRVFVVGAPYVTIQEAIDAAACGDIVIIPAGVHYGDINFNGKNIIVSSSNPDDPMVVALTVIHGSGAGPVVTFSGSESQSCVLDGLTITDGNTAGDGGGICGNGTEATIANCVITNNHADGVGGGVSNCSGTIVGCTITDNTAHSGGGISGFNSPILIEDCRISRNNSARYGGGVFLEGYAGPGFGGVPQVRQCLITENTAGEDGGGMSNWGSHLVVTNCTFGGNYSQFGGGGMTNGGSNTTVTNCTFSDNSTNAGGGGMFNYYSSPLVIDCIFRGNSANFGGGMENSSSRSSPTLINCTFIGNTANKDGGGMRNRYPNTPALTNCLFSGNSAGDEGGGIRNESSSSPTFANCTFSGNSAESTGGGMSNHHDSSPMLTNCILWGNDDSGGMGESAQIVGGKVVVTYSCIQGLVTFMGNNNIGDAPLFVDADGTDNVAGTEDDNLRLSFGSPCIDAGDNTAVPPSVLTDLDGNPRIRGDAVDMGAYEFQGPFNRYYHVDGVNGDNTNDGLTPGTAFATIQKGIDTALNGDTVLVADGTYTGDGNRDIDFKGKAITVRSENGPQTCIIDCQGEAYDHHHRGFYFHNAESEYAVLEGFTILNGVHGSGGGIYCADGASPTIRNNIIEGNRISFGGDGGGGIACKFGASPVIVGNVIRNNYCEPGGGGGGIHCYEAGSPLICYNVITGNHASGGGGISIAYGTNAVTIVGNLIVANDAIRAGAITSWATNCDLTISNNTIVGNVSEYTSGGINIEDTINAAITNCIIWGNRDRNGTIESSQITGSSTNYSCIQGWTGALGGTGNIGDDPLFADPDNGDYHLRWDSACINTGDLNYVPEPGETDLDGKPRIIGGRIDMGVYEFQILYVDDDSPNDPGPGDPAVSDPLENGTEAHPFDTIQEAINVAEDGYTVLVRPGSYLEPASGDSIDFLGKNITLTSADPTDWDIVDNTIIRGYVQFSGTEGPNCKFAGFRIGNFYGAVYGNHTHAAISHCNISGNGPCGATVIKDCDGIISNCLITDNTTFFYCGVYPVVFGCNGLIKNCTIANNLSGVSVGTATIENCIIYNNFGSQLAVTSGGTLNISYSNVQGGLEEVVVDGSVEWGPGNIDTNPYFVRSGYWEDEPWELIEGDYHSKSEGWRWNTEGKSWTYDYITSRCIDAGNQGARLGGELMSVPRDPDNIWGVNLRINMGAYGGTNQASMPPHGWTLLADLNNDGTVNFLDFAHQTQDWLKTALEQPGDLNRDGVMNMLDLAALAENWLQVTDWVE